MNYVSGLLSSMYGNTLSIGNASVVGTPSASVLARVEQTLAPQRASALQINTSLSSTQAKLSGLGQLQSALSVFQDLAQDLAGAGLSTRASVTAPKVLSAATSAAAAVGSHTIEVSQLAQQQVLLSAEADTGDTPLGTGATTIVRVRAGDSTKLITIDSRNNTLQGIADAFKQAGLDASLVRSSTGTALQLRSASGAAQALQITVAGDTTLRNLFNGLAQTQAASDAVFTVDGKALRSASNTVTSAIPGATLTLTGTGSSNLTIARDESQISKNVASFVSGFNALQDRLDSLQKSSLKGNAALSQVSTQLGQLVRGPSADALEAAGLSVDRNGRLKLDSARLDAAVAADPEALTRLFTNEGRGFADVLASRLDTLADTRGVVGRAVTQTDRELDNLQERRSRLAQSLTAQAQALVRLYSQQEQQGSSSILDLFA